MNHFDSDKARAVQRMRRERRNAQGIDILAERARLIGRWKVAAECNVMHRPHNGAWWWPFVASTSFVHLLMPQLRASIEAANLNDHRTWLAELRASAKRRQSGGAPQTMELFA
jgi:hypothetical protein